VRGLGAVASPPQRRRWSVVAGQRTDRNDRRDVASAAAGVDQHQRRVEAVGGDGPVHRRDNAAAGMVRWASRVSISARMPAVLPSAIPVGLMRGRERPACPRLRQRGRAGQPTGFVLSTSSSGPAQGPRRNARPPARGERPASRRRHAVVDLDRPGREPDREPAAGVTSRDRIKPLPHRHPGPIVHPRFELPSRIERLARQRHNTQRSSPPPSDTGRSQAPDAR